jgi:hypothetical protein
MDVHPRRFSPWDVFGVAIVVAFAISLFVLSSAVEERPPADVLLMDPSTAVQLGDEWMGIQYQGRKVGLLHLRKSARKAGGYHFALRTHLRLIGFDGDATLVMDVGADLTAAMALERFDFRVEAGPAVFRGAGTVRDGALALHIETGGAVIEETVPLDHPPVLRANLGAVLSTKRLEPGAVLRFHVFDPLTRRQQAIDVEVVGPETLHVLGHAVPAIHIRQRFGGMVLNGWLNGRGEMLKQELGLGLVAVRETEEEARFGLLPANAGVDLVRATMIPVAGLPASLTARSRLALQLSGLPAAGMDLSDRRQRLVDGVLTVTREPVGRGLLIPVSQPPSGSLAADALIQSDHPRIVAAARRIKGDALDTLTVARRLLAWLRENIEQKGVMGVPSALETLETRVGDCNEHSTLFAALARSVGVPTRLVVGLVYVKGRFGYHAWNEVLTADGWLSVDATWGQLPVDVGHLAFLRGGLEQQVRLLPLMGRLRITVP